MTSYWDVFGEIFGMPMRVGTTTSQNPADRNQIEVMLEEMGAAGWALFPEGTTIDIKESSRGDAYNVYDKRIDRANSEMSKGVVGQTMTVDDGSSKSQSETHLEVFENLCAADAKLIAYVINDDLIPKMIRLGFLLPGLRSSGTMRPHTHRRSSANWNVCSCSSSTSTRSISLKNTKSRFSA